MTIYNVECLRIKKDDQTFTLSTLDVESETPNGAVKQFICDYLPPLKLDCYYLSEFQRLLRTDPTKHYVSYAMHTSDKAYNFYLNCRYLVPKKEKKEKKGKDEGNT